MKFLFCFALVALANLTIAEKVRYDNYKLVRLTPATENQLKMINSFQTNPDFDFWTGIKSVGNTVDVALAPESFLNYKALFKSVKLPFQIIQKNIQDIIDEQERSMHKATRNNNIVGKYARYSQITSFIDTLVSENSDLVSAYSAGTTYESRDIKVIKINNQSSANKKTIWMDCGIHAREYVSVSTCVYIIDRLIKDYRANEPMAVGLLEKYEFHVMPVANPDGYEYTFTGMRLWRKNRNPNYSLGSSCIGTDVNRNFDYKWMFSGSSQYPCSDIYAGRSGGSELETKAIKNAVLAIKESCEVFVTLHSFGGYWMPPWAWGSELPADYPELEELSKIAVNAIEKVHGEKFLIGTPYMTLNYAASGGSYDWVKAIAGVKYAYALELRPSSGTSDSSYGFMLPENRAILAGEETYAGLFALFDAIKAKNQ